MAQRYNLYFKNQRKMQEISSGRIKKHTGATDFVHLLRYAITQKMNLMENPSTYLHCCTSVTPVLLRYSLVVTPIGDRREI